MMVPEPQVFASDVILCVLKWLKCSHICTSTPFYICLFLSPHGHLYFSCLYLFFSLCCSSAFLLLSVDGIVSFLKKQAGPASVELKADTDLAKYTSDQDASVVGELLFEFQSLLVKVGNNWTMVITS